MKPLIRTQFGNPVLRAKAKKVKLEWLQTPEFKKLVRTMFFTMHHANGVGLAAPQVGLSLQLAVIEVKPTKFRPKLQKLKKTVIINPRITWRSSKKEEDWEGCLSFPAARGVVPRAEKIGVQYTDEQGKTVTRALKGFLARVFQHEIDHLTGHVYVDRMKDMKTLMTLGEFKKRIMIRK